MTTHNSKLEESVEEAAELAEENWTAFAKNLQVTHEFELTHGALHSNFAIVYIDPISKASFKHTDYMLWNDTDEILQEGQNAGEIKNYNDTKLFGNDIEVKGEDGTWVQVENEETREYLLELADLYRQNLNIDELLPSWKEKVVQKVTELYGED